MALAGRLRLHEKLVEILGSRYVYYRPGDLQKINYPCIMYERANIDTRYADNGHYIDYDRYNVTVIDEDPDSEIVERMMTLELTSFDRHYFADGLNHTSFTVYHL